MKVVALIPAAGSGSRMGVSEKKPYLSLEGKPILAHTLIAFERCPLIDEVVLIVAKGDVEFSRMSIVEPFKCDKVKAIVEGGMRRQDSVWEGLKAIRGKCELVMVHDGVRPFVSQTMLECAVRETPLHGATVVAVPVKDTIKVVSKEAEVVETVDRSRVWAAQTPQTFRFEVIMKAYERAYEEGFYGTDDASLVERLGMKVKIIPGSYENVKITTLGDLALGEVLVKKHNSL